MELQKLLTKAAKDAGFPLVGTIDIDLALADPEKLFQAHLNHFDHWIASGYAGAMEYLVRGRDRRSDPRLLFPQAQSLLCVAWPYPTLPQGGPTPAEGPRYARYLKGPDYHLGLAQKLETVMQTVRDQWQGTTPLEWKVCVDTSAILERSWAALAGLGWIGKNTLLIHPQYGSYLFIAEVLINQKTGQGPHLLPNYCGNCTRCLDACPTQAFVGPGRLNSNLCISYQTLEKRGEISLPIEVQPKVGGWIAGCDRCQEVCPFNTKPVQKEEKAKASAAMAVMAADLYRWEDLLKETEEQYKERVKTSALKRVKPAQFRRNLALTLENTLRDLGQAERDRLLETVLPLIQSRLKTETDPIAFNYWQRCIQSFSNFDPS